MSQVVRDVLARRHATAISGRQPGTGPGAEPGTQPDIRLPDVTERRRRDGYNTGLRHGAAIPALDLAQSADQVHARAFRAAVEVSGPVRAGLAVWADQHLAVGKDAAPPGATSPFRIDLPSAAAIAGHVPPVPTLPV